jgi:CheY-like chemotaxis protein
MTDSTSQTPPAQGAGGRRVLIVDDADELRELYRFALQNEGYEVRTAPVAESALDLASEWRPDLVLTDLFMPGMGGLELITRLRSDFTPPVPPIVVISGFPDVMAEALKRGALRFESKPVSPDELVHIVEDAFAVERVPRLRSPEIVRVRRDANRAIGEATLTKYLTEDPGVFARVDVQARALARFFGHSSVLVFVLRNGKLTLASSSDPSYPRDADATEILPIVQDVVETGGSLLLTNGATRLLSPGHGWLPGRFLVAVPWFLDRAAVGVLCLVDQEPHDFGSAALGILEYMTRRGAAVIRGGRPALDDSGLFDRAAFAAILQGSTLHAQSAGHAFGVALCEVDELPRDGALTKLLTNLPAPNLMVGVSDRHHLAAFAVGESIGRVQELLVLTRREIERHLIVTRTAEVTYDDPIPRLEPGGFIARARDVLARAEEERTAFLAVDAARRQDPVCNAVPGDGPD